MDVDRTISQLTSYIEEQNHKVCFVLFYVWVFEQCLRDVSFIFLKRYQGKHSRLQGACVCVHVCKLLSLMSSLQWLDMEQSRDRKDDMSEMEDPRVDICIFAIPPHR